VVSDILIRKFCDADRGAIRRIACETAFAGLARNAVFDDDELLADILTLYYTDYEPDSCFVAACGKVTVGYVVGTKDARAMRRIFYGKIISQAVARSLARGSLLKRNNRGYILQVIAGYLRGEFYVPDFTKDYPATLHINIDEGFRGQKVGTLLIERYLGFFREEKIPGFHCSVISEKAKIFFEKFGCMVLFKNAYSHLRYLEKEINHYILGKRL